jgi:hypothetical protein
MTSGIDAMSATEPGQARTRLAVEPPTIEECFMTKSPEIAVRQLIESEASVELYLVREVAKRGGMAEKMKALGRRGFFDRLVTVPVGRVFFVELKRSRGGKLYPHQAKRIRDYDDLGARVYICRSRAEVDLLLVAIDRPV